LCRPDVRPPSRVLTTGEREQLFGLLSSWGLSWRRSVGELRHGDPDRNSLTDRRITETLIEVGTSTQPCWAPRAVTLRDCGRLLAGRSADLAAVRNATLELDFCLVGGWPGQSV